MANDTESQPPSGWPADRWDRIDDLLQSALKLQPSQREAYLRDACAGDDPLLREVESLLSSHEQAASFLETPALDVSLKRIAEAGGALIGRRIGSYELLDLVGSGGMGEVYRARDTRLNRTVAIKILAAHPASNPNQRHRFEREARAVSSLNHPNICTLYDIGLHDDVHYLVMEYLEGGTLADRLRQGALPIGQALQYGVQLAGALSEAHRKGVVHRDIKPGNVMLVKSGTKLLDFGLARLSQPVAPDASTLNTAAAPQDGTRTAEGTILGTVQYMAPEQLEGGYAGARTDIFAFGALLFEMVTGRKAFEGKSQASLIAAIMTSAPPRISALQPLAPEALDHLVRRCLEKDPEERWQSAHDLRSQLAWIAETVSRDGPPAASLPIRATRRQMLWSLLGIPLGAALTWYLDHRSEYWWTTALLNAARTRITNFPGTEVEPTISRDGNLVAFLSDRDGQFDVWAGQVGGDQFNNLTDGHFPDIRNPEVRSIGFLPNGREVWFWRRTEEPSSWTVPFIGGSVGHYSSGIEPDWSAEGRMVYHPAAPGDPLFVTEPGEKEGTPIHRGKTTEHCHFPVWSPTGDYIYFVQGYPPNEMDIWRIRPAGGSPEQMTSYKTRISHLTFLDRRTLLYISLDRDGSGPWLYGMDVEDRVPHRLSNGPEPYTAVAKAADSDRIVATAANPVANLWQVAIPETGEIVDDTAVTELPLSTARALSPRLGPDYALYLSSMGGIDGILKQPSSGPAEILWDGSRGRVTAGPSISQDASRIAFTAQREGRTRLYIMNVDRTGERELPLRNPGGEGFLDARGAPAWSPGGSIIVGAALETDPNPRPRLYRVPVDGGPLEKVTDSECLNPVWSPDGRYLLYWAEAASVDFVLGAVTSEGHPHPIPNLGLSRGSTRVAFLPKSQSLVVLKGSLEHKNFFMVDLKTGLQRQLTRLSTKFRIHDFDISRDGTKIVFDSVEENSKVLLIDLSRRPNRTRA